MLTTDTHVAIVNDMEETPMTYEGIGTQISEAALRLSVQAIGGNPDDKSHQIIAAMIMDPEFRENVTRFYFQRSLEIVRAA